MARTGVRDLPGWSGFESAFRGRLIRPKDADYDEARRVWNGAIDRHPAIVARCAGREDVAAAVRFARERDLPLAVRGGAHGVAGNAVCDDGLVVDLSGMKRVAVDADARRAMVDPGVLWGEMNAATQAAGLATTGGIISHTGVAGLTLGGGIGWLMRKHGLTCDSLVGAGVVSAEGELLRAGEEEDPDLLWALRGGGGNFGVVTTFDFALHPVGPTVLAGALVYHADDAGRVLAGYREVVRDAPRELTTILNLRAAPPAPWLPPEVHGLPVVLLGVCYAGSPEEGQAVVEPLRRLGSLLVDAVGPMPYTDLNAMFDAAVPHGLRYYWKSEDVADLSDGVIEVLRGGAWHSGSARSFTIIFHLGGAVRDVAEGDTAYSGRSAGYAVNVNAVWEEGDGAEHVAWCRRLWEDLRPHGMGNVYVNFLGDEGSERVAQAYGEGNLARLSRLKARYDPHNVFRLNQNIRPAS